MSHSMCLQIALLLALTLGKYSSIYALAGISLVLLGVSCQSSAYYGYLGYSAFSAQVLQYANESISLSFKLCETDGILLYATDEGNLRYFAVGVHRSKLLVEFDLGDDIREVNKNA